MAPSRLDRLPTELLFQIGQLLYDTHKPSIGSLTLVNKTLKAIADDLAFRTLTIVVKDIEQLARDVQSLTPRITNHIRHLFIEGSLTHARDFTPQKKGPDMEYVQEAFKPGFPFFSSLCRIPPGRSSKSSQSEAGWIDLAGLIDQMPSLSSVSYVAPEPLPQCLFDSIQRKGTCQLHMLYSLQSFLFSHDERLVAIETSTCLRSIVTDYTTQEFIEHILNLANGPAKNLDRIHIHDFPHPWSEAVSPGDDPVPSAPESLPGSKEKDSGKGSLKRLIFDLSPAYFDDVPKRVWPSVTDLSILRKLEFNNEVDTEFLELLTRDANFPSLKTLVLALMDIRQFHGTGEDQMLKTMEHASAASSFLRSIPPLSALKVRAEFRDPIFDTIIEHHGSTLRKLALVSLGYYNQMHFRVAQVNQIAEHCPELEELAITVPRTRGNKDEVLIYHALGSILKLQHLYLSLDCADHSVGPKASNISEWHHFNRFHLTQTTQELFPNDPSFDDFDQQGVEDARGLMGELSKPRYGHIRDAFVNGALDEDLAKAIFQKISEGKQPGSSRLQTLAVKAIGGCIFKPYPSPDGCLSVMKQISRPCFVERHPRDDMPNDLLVTCPREIPVSRQSMVIGSSGDETVLRGDAQPVFDRIWSQTADNQNLGWWERWHSLPLAKV
jgi:hypothetical protein